jgi:hypothetical protein
MSTRPALLCQHVAMNRLTAAVAAILLTVALAGCLAEEDPCACQFAPDDTASPSASTPR